MDLDVFPFGKYKGTKTKDLPSTYIALALEKFYLPEEFERELRHILLGRLQCFSKFKENLVNDGYEHTLMALSHFEKLYERKGVDNV